jgi:hypothetical protein
MAIVVGGRCSSPHSAYTLTVELRKVDCAGALNSH